MMKTTEYEYREVPRFRGGNNVTTACLRLEREGWEQHDYTSQAIVYRRPKKTPAERP